MTEYVFLYGTLLPEHAPEEIKAVVAKLRPYARGSVRGVLFDFGDYPGAVLDPRSDKNIFGTVFRLPKNSSVLDELDEYEGFHRSALHNSLFIRKRHPVRLLTGRVLDCWIYEYNGKHVVAPVVANGRYRAKHTATR